MFKKIKDRIMNLNYRKTAIFFFVISLTAILVCGIISAVSLKTQIGEVISYHRSYENEHEKSDLEKYQLQEHGHEEHNEEFFSETDFTEPSVFAKISVGITGIICITALAFYWLFTAAWLYRSANKASMNGFLWGIFGLIGNLAAVLIFLIARSTLKSCPDCGIYQKGGTYCRSCGKRLPYVCQYCGEIIDKDDKFCRNCGKNLEK